MDKQIEVFGLMGDPDLSDKTLIGFYRESTESTKVGLKAIRLDHDEWTRAREAGVPAVPNADDGYVIEVAADRLAEVPALA